MRTIDLHKSKQKENVICSIVDNVFIANVDQISHLLLFFLMVTHVNERHRWLLLRHFSCVSYIYQHVQVCVAGGDGAH